MKFYVYILRSKKSEKYYVGQTDDIFQRLLEHNVFSEKSYTSKYRPWVLKSIFYIGSSRGIALKIERYIKKQKSRKYIEDLINKNSIEQLIEKYNSVD